MKLRATLELRVARLKPNTEPIIEFSNCMQEQENIKERESRLDWKRWLNYQSLVKQVPFFLFLAALAVIYIYNGHYADKTIRNINRTAKEVKELQWEYKTVKSEVMFQSKQSELVKAVEPLGLKELTEAPFVLNNEEEKKAKK